MALDPNAVRPTVLIDTREQTPLVFNNLPSQRGTLTTGDYSFIGGESLMAIERKSLEDLVSCCMADNRDRFERELERIRGYRWRHLLVIATEAQAESGAYRSNLNPKSLLHTVRAFEARYDLMVTWEPDAARAAMLVESWAYWAARELVRAAAIIEKSQAPKKPKADKPLAS
jgi:DNA excision repair protein ERCC-4